MNIKTTITALLGLIILLTLHSASTSFAQNTFPCDGKFYFFGDSLNNATIAYVDGLPNNPVAHQVCLLPTQSNNAMACNPVDHYIYYESGSNLYKVDNQCNTTLICSNFGSPDQACFDYLGRYWFNGGIGFEALDINTCAIVAGPYPIPGTGGSVIDFAFNPNNCSFVFLSADSIYQVDTLGVVISTIAGGFGNISGTFGGVAMGYNNLFYGMLNSSAILYSTNLITGAVDSICQVPFGNTGFDAASFLCNQVTAYAAATPDTGCPGLTVHFADTSTGTGNIRLWNFGDPSSGANDTSTLQNPTHTFDTSGLYHVSLAVHTNPGGMCIPPGYDSTSITVFIYNLPIPNAGPDQAMCLGDSVTLLGTGSGHFVWSPANTLSCDTCHQPWANPTITTSYILTFSDSATGCVNRDTTKVTVNPHPAVPVISNIGTIPICPGDSVQLTGTPIAHDSLLWSPSLTLSCDSCPTPWAFPTASTTYFLLVSDSTTGCTSLDSFNVPVKPAPIISNSGNTAICIGDSTTISGFGQGTSNWSPSTGLSCDTCHSPIANPTSTTEYHWTVTDPSSLCSTTDSLQVVVNPLPSITLNNLDSICMGDSIALNANGTGNYNWTWTPTTGLNCPTCPNPQAFPTTTTLYHLLITDAVTGCFITDSATVKVNLLPVIKIHSDSTVCFGDSLTILATGGISYTWNGNVIADTFINSPVNDTIYYVIGTNGICFNYDTAKVRVLPNPSPTITDTTVCEGEIITLTASGRALIVWYSFNDQTTPINIGYTFTTPHNTSTTIYYIASDSAMCHSLPTQFTINVEPCPIFIPNVFTPNGDHINDLFTIDAKGFAGLHVIIYNRWGMKIYEWFTTNGGWNGETSSGAKCPDGVYYYIVDLVDFYGNGSTQAGDIELISK